MFFLTSCSSLFYYPSRQLFYAPDRFGLKPDEITFPSHNGKKIFAWYFKNRSGQKPKATVVFYHGNAENISSHYINIIWILDHGYDLLGFDYQGYGRSEGEPSQENTVRDGEAALKYAFETYKTPLVVFAQSLGGPIAMRNVIDLKDSLPIKYLAVDSTFVSYRSMARTVMTRSVITWPFQWLGWLLVSDSYSPKNDIDKISPIPLLVIHGDNDKVVEYFQGQKVFELAKEPKEFWTVPGGSHTDVFSKEDPTFRLKFVERLDRAVASPSQK